MKVTYKCTLESGEELIVANVANNSNCQVLQSFVNPHRYPIFVQKGPPQLITNGEKPTQISNQVSTLASEKPQIPKEKPDKPSVSSVTPPVKPSVEKDTTRAGEVSIVNEIEEFEEVPYLVDYPDYDYNYDYEVLSTENLKVPEEEMEDTSVTPSMEYDLIPEGEEASKVYDIDEYEDYLYDDAYDNEVYLDPL